MAQKTLILSGISFALALAFAPAVQAAPEQVCTQNFASAANVVNSDLKAAGVFLDKIGDSCSGDISPANAQILVSHIKTVVAGATAAVVKGGDKEEAGKILSVALAVAGQPAIVAVDPTLYSSVLADSANFAELARDEDADGALSKDVQFARLPGSLPNNNQQPTVSVEQK